MSSDGAWKLRAELLGHEQDVRGINNCDAGLVTCSRDKTIRVWTPVDARAFESAQILIGHEHFVACAVQLPASPAHPSGAIASGGYDRTMSGQTIVKPVVNIWEAGAIVATLEGHALTVCGLAMTPSGHLVSVSWDKTARVWDLTTRQCVTVMAGHEQAVWAVLCLEDGRMLTASADKTIKRWNGATCEHTYVGHSDCVRALAMMPGIGFVSTGNDCSIRMWAVSGECLMTMSGHGSFVYSLAVLPTGEVVSASEDRTARVWKDGQCVGTIAHGGSVWAVAALPDGDIGTACADGVARVFTRDPAKMADAAQLEAYDAMISAQTVSAQEVRCAPGRAPPTLSPTDQCVEREGREGGRERAGWSARDRETERVRLCAHLCVRGNVCVSACTLVYITGWWCQNGPVAWCRSPGNAWQQRRTDQDSAHWRLRFRLLLELRREQVGPSGYGCRWAGRRRRRRRRRERRGRGQWSWGIEWSQV